MFLIILTSTKILLLNLLLTPLFTHICPYHIQIIKVNLTPEGAPAGKISLDLFLFGLWLGLRGLFLLDLHNMLHRLRFFNWAQGQRFGGIAPDRILISLVF